MLPVIAPESMLITEDPVDEFMTDSAMRPGFVTDVRRDAFSIRSPIADPLIVTP